MAASAHSILRSCRLYLLLAVIASGVLWLLWNESRPGFHDFHFNHNGKTARARVIEDSPLALEIEEDGTAVYSCQTRAVFNGLNGYNAKWIDADTFVIHSGDIGPIEFEKDDAGNWTATNTDVIHWQRTLFNKTSNNLLKP